MPCVRTDSQRVLQMMRSAHWTTTIVMKYVAWAWWSASFWTILDAMFWHCLTLLAVRSDGVAQLAEHSSSQYHTCITWSLNGAHVVDVGSLVGVSLPLQNIAFSYSLSPISLEEVHWPPSAGL